MISDKVTVVYATSPHRFEDSTCMIDLSIATLKEYGFAGCKFVICADGINEDSRYAQKEQREKYEAYLKKLQRNYRGTNFKVIISEKNIGLTLNYMQAWDHNEVNTDYVFFMNHDAAINPGFHLVNLEKIVDQFPEEAKTLMFARDDNQFWKRWFQPKEYNLDGVWKNALQAFAFQDNGCLMRQEAFSFYFKNFYDPNITKFLEDSLQRKLEIIGSKNDQLGWKKFGAFVWNQPLTFHIDGQSKADNKNFSEKVWSKGFCHSKNLKKLQEHTEERSSLWVCVENFINQEKKIQSAKIFDSFNDFAARLINITNLNFEPVHDFSVDNIGDIGVAPKVFPKRTALREKIKVKEDSIEFCWKQSHDQNIVAKVIADGEQIAYGGNAKGSIDVPFSDKLQTHSKVKFILEEFDEDGLFEKEIINEEVDLSVFSLTPDYALFRWQNSPQVNLVLEKRESENWARKTYTCAWTGDGPQKYLFNFVENNMLYGEKIYGCFKNPSTGYVSWPFYIDVPCGYKYDYSFSQKAELIIRNVHNNLMAMFPDHSAKNINGMLQKLKG